MTERMRIDKDGNVGIGTANPQVKLHVDAGTDGTAVKIQGQLNKGRLGFVNAGETDSRTVLYRSGGGTPIRPDITTLRNFPPSTPPMGEEEVVWTILKIWAPEMKSPPASQDREATLALVRDLIPGSSVDQEFIDVYNNGYSSETQFGIRIQKRGTASYRDFVFDQHDGSSPKLTIMTLKADRTVALRSHGDVTNWSGTDSIHATAAVKTTDGTTTTLASIPLADSRAYHIAVRVVARKSDGTQRAFYWRAALAFRQGGGATLEGSVVSLATIV